MERKRKTSQSIGIKGFLYPSHSIANTWAKIVADISALRWSAMAIWNPALHSDWICLGRHETAHIRGLLQVIEFVSVKEQRSITVLFDQI